ncbi:MAG: response regulator [Candidatus Aminicenantes bacterium]|nr:response regulator [Candidatus Aminicenantes bacterium]
MSEKANILIIDDDEAILDSCSQVLLKAGYSVKGARDGEEGLKLFKSESFHMVLLDLKLPGSDGIEVLGHIKTENPETPVIIMTGYASVESAVGAMKQGAFDYMAKPFSPKELRVNIRKALNNRKMLMENLYLRKELEAKIEFDLVVGKSEAMEAMLDVVKKVSPSESTVLISGESGTGKEILAREIHKHSLRRDGPFVVVDCGALVETLFESELFGHVRGSFTGAYETKHGRFELANGGTVFLDEISNISLNIQAKLLRVIQEKEVTRVGSAKSIKIDVRIIAATHEDLAEAVKGGKFREDLFYRLSVVPIHVPPLRERKEDIPLLVDHFLLKYNKRAKKNIQSVSPQILEALRAYDWPGNIRELENTIERAIVLTRNDQLGLEDLIYHGIGSGLSFLEPVGGKYKTLDEIEKEYIKAVIRAHHGNKSKTAKILSIDRKTLLSKLKRYNIQ